MLGCLAVNVIRVRMDGLKPMIRARRAIFGPRRPTWTLELETVAEVLRRYGLDAATYYRWERAAKAGMREALSERPSKGAGADREVERLRTELEQKRRVIAEVVEENLELKKGL